MHSFIDWEKQEEFLNSLTTHIYVNMDIVRLSHVVREPI